ncbi:MAG: hypothetical protein JWP65_3473 [Ramlibacter sp.]|jgi:hypothetical protein|uniref:DUF4864 domain-containing protein n=1 Tax=Ramlibacter sp. TaxID=1917967 RepID=UPI0026079B25|nr:DUF4864 domain-containing protein [Ramlibacter sp.]MDB5753052.1 hypothetical protein [Ramlibacter sp.]
MTDHQTDPAERPSRPRSPASAWSLLFCVILLGAIFSTDMPKASPDPTAVRDVVQRQLQALAADDAGAAFALADPGLRTRFGNADEFLAMLRSQYPMVAHPASVLFLKPQSDGSLALQKVRVTDTDGAGWLVTYVLNRQGDRWLISACMVTPDSPKVMA